MFNINTKTNNYMSIVLTHECNRKCHVDGIIKQSWERTKLNNRILNQFVKTR